MAKAAPQEQMKLLDLQALDAKLKSLANRAAKVKADPRVAELSAAVNGARTELAAAETALKDAQRELARAEGDVEQVAGRIQRDEARLNSGTGLSKDLLALQHDIASLNKRRSDLEDIELEAMERVDTLSSDRDAKQQAGTAHEKAFEELRAELQAELSALEAERKTVAAQRTEFAAGIDPALLALYEKTLQRRGIGAARLFHGKSEGSGFQLSPGDLADITKAAEDDVVFCPDSGCILVRSSEWGS